MESEASAVARRIREQIHIENKHYFGNEENSRVVSVRERAKQRAQAEKKASPLWAIALSAGLMGLAVLMTHWTLVLVRWSKKLERR